MVVKENPDRKKKWIMVFMRSQRKMPAFLCDFLGHKIFRKLKVSADFLASYPKLRGNCVFYLKWYKP